MPKYVEPVSPHYYPPNPEPTKDQYVPQVIIRDRYVNPEASCAFRTIFAPVNSLHPIISPNENGVRIILRRKNRTVTMQWEPFTGVIGVNGISYIASTQSIDNLPPHPIEQVIRILYNGAARQAFVQVNPSESDQIRFYLDFSGSGSSVSIGDSFTVFGGTLTWIMDEKSHT